MYVVILEGQNHPARPTALVAFSNKEDFNTCLNDERRKRYRVIKEGISKSDATEFCRSQGLNPSDTEEILFTLFPD